VQSSLKRTDDAALIKQRDNSLQRNLDWIQSAVTSGGGGGVVVEKAMIPDDSYGAGDLLTCWATVSYSANSRHNAIKQLRCTRI